MASGTYRFMEVNRAGTVIQGELNVPVAPGDFIDLEDTDLENEHNAALIAEGDLVNVDDIVTEEDANPDTPDSSEDVDKSGKPKTTASTKEVKK